jgi:hypothetical protein
VCWPLFRATAGGFPACRRQIHLELASDVDQALEIRGRMMIRPGAATTSQLPCAAAKTRVEFI